MKITLLVWSGKKEFDGTGWYQMILFDVQFAQGKPMTWSTNDFYRTLVVGGEGGSIFTRHDDWTFVDDEGPAQGRPPLEGYSGPMSFMLMKPPRGPWDKSRNQGDAVLLYTYNHTVRATTGCYARWSVQY